MNATGVFSIVILVLGFGILIYEAVQERKKGRRK